MFCSQAKITLSQSVTRREQAVPHGMCLFIFIISMLPRAKRPAARLTKRLMIIKHVFCIEPRTPSSPNLRQYSEPNPPLHPKERLTYFNKMRNSDEEMCVLSVKYLWWGLTSCCACSLSAMMWSLASIWALFSCCFLSPLAVSTTPFASFSALSRALIVLFELSDDVISTPLSLCVV